MDENRLLLSECSLGERMGEQFANTGMVNVVGD